MKVSFVIPCYRSEKTIERVYEEIIHVIKQREGILYEIIAVNDCSPDKVLSVLIALASKDSNFKVIDCAKNMGKHAALMAGFRYTTGDYVVCVDDDYQCPVDRLWDLLSPLDEGYDVSMAQYGKKKQSKFKNFGSRMNDWMMTYMIGKPKDFQFANFSAMKAFVDKEIIKYDNPYSYVNGLILRSTNKIVNVKMEERSRLEGTGGYTFKKSIALWINGFTAFSIIPVRIATYMGLIFSLFGFILGIIMIVRKFVSPFLGLGNGLVIAVIVFVGGILMVLMGILGEYVGRIYISINNSPQYVIRDTWNIEKEENKYKCSGEYCE